MRRLVTFAGGNTCCVLSSQWSLDAAASDVALSSVPLAPLTRVPFLSCLECRSVFGGRTEGCLRALGKDYGHLGSPSLPILPVRCLQWRWILAEADPAGASGSP